jgi:excisionase family DNA binding protein
LTTPVPEASTRLALGAEEAAKALGVSRDTFEEHVAPEVRKVRAGRRILYPVRELERWLEESAARVDVGP